MDVPATRPEVTTTGIYGEELALMRQRLRQSELAWCGDLTARTQVLIVGRVTPVGSRKLAVARARRLPCVSPAWVTEGASSSNTTEAFDISHELSGKEVCTTSLDHVERGRVQAVCAARSAAYNALLTRGCSLLVAPAAALASTSPSASSPATANDKIRFARKHGIWIMSLDDFALRYGVEGVAKRGHHRMYDAGEGLDSEGRKESSGASKVLAEPQTDVKGNDTNSSSSTAVLVPGSVRCTARSVRSYSCTPRSSAAVSAHHQYKPLAPPPLRAVEDSWRGTAGTTAMMSAIQPTLPSQLTAIAATGISSTPSQPARLQGDEFSDVVAYCSPPHRLTTAQHYLLSAMGVTITPQLTPHTTHVLVLGGDATEESLFPRPGLQIVDWRWVAQSYAEQRRLSCAAFRLSPHFSPVLAFTGLCAIDKQELVAALRRSGLACEVQEALVLGGGGCRGANGRSNPTTAEGSSFLLPKNTTHLVSLRRHLLASQKVAVLAQHCQQQQQQQQQARRRLSASPPLVAAPSVPCRLIDVDWVYRSIQQGQWLDPEAFALAIPHPEAFGLAAASAAATHKAQMREGLPRSRPPFQMAVAESSVDMRPCSQLSFPPSLASAPAAAPPTPPTISPTLSQTGRSPSRLVAVVVVKEEEEEVKGAAHSQHRNTSGDAEGHEQDPSTAFHAHPAPPSSYAARRVVDDDEDEEAGGESPSATAARHSVLQALHTPQPLPSQKPSPAKQQQQQQPGAVDSRGEINVAVDSSESAAPARLSADSTATATHLYIGTQYSPSFENLLGELEAYPSGGEVGGALPFASLGGVEQAPHIALPLLTHGPPGGAQQMHDAESALYSPPQQQQQQSSVALQQRAVLQRASLYRQHPRGRPPLQHHLLQQQEQQRHQSVRQQRRCFTAVGHTSDESQVISYHMEGLGGDPFAAVAAASAEADTDASTPSTPPTSTVVFSISKDVFVNCGFDWEAFAALLPHVRRTKTPEECTHCVIGKPNKTEHFLCALAAGKWVLTPDYLAACAAAGRLVPETDFEWTMKMAERHHCGSSVAALVQGCRLQRTARERPFARWQVLMCCATAARVCSFTRVLRNGGCVSVKPVSPAELLEMAEAGEAALQLGSSPDGKTNVLVADEKVFTQEEVERYGVCAAAHGLCPLLRIDYVALVLYDPQKALSEESLLRSTRTHKRSRSESQSTR